MSDLARAYAKYLYNREHQPLLPLVPWSVNIISDEWTSLSWREQNKLELKADRLFKEARAEGWIIREPTEEESARGIILVTQKPDHLILANQLPLPYDQPMPERLTEPEKCCCGKVLDAPTAILYGPPKGAYLAGFTEWSTVTGRHPLCDDCYAKVLSTIEPQACPANKLKWTDCDQPAGHAGEHHYVMNERRQ